MSNRSTHATVGAGVGAGFAFIRADGAPGPQVAAEVLGGALGGWIGGVLPDVLEPATTPNHRALAHSLVAGGALSFARLAEWQAMCRTRSDSCTSRALCFSAGSQESQNAQREALLWRLIAGVLAGLVAGYASHLVLDAATPKGLPILL